MLPVRMLAQLSDFSSTLFYARSAPSVSPAQQVRLFRFAPMAPPVKSAKREVQTDSDTAGSLTCLQDGRIRVLKEGKVSEKGPVVYWMFRDQRSRDNWALIHAVHQAKMKDAPVAVAFNLFEQFLGAKARQLGFMVRGLRELERNLNALDIPFFLFQGEAVDNIPNFLKDCNASLLVMDFSPLRDVRGWKDEICKRVSDSVAVHQVDAHNIVPLWVASQKLEYSAKTIRSKIHKLLPEYLIDFPTLQAPSRKWTAGRPTEIDWEKLIADILRKGADVPELNWCEPGQQASMEMLLGSKDGFLTARLKNYSNDRNNPRPNPLEAIFVFYP